jgi:hypothetical protein
MTAEARLYEVLSPLLPGKVFPDFAKAGTKLPYVVYQVVGGDPFNTLTGEAPEKQQVRVQVSAWAEGRLEVSQLGADIEAAIRAATDLQPTVLTGRLSLVDEETSYRGTRQEFYLFC